MALSKDIPNSAIRPISTSDIPGYRPLHKELLTLPRTIITGLVEGLVGHDQPQASRIRQASKPRS